MMKNSASKIHFMKKIVANVGSLTCFKIYVYYLITYLCVKKIDLFP